MKNENLYDEFFVKYGVMYGVAPALLKAQVRQESAFNPKAKSPVGAKGLAQFMPATWREWGGGTDIYSAEDNIKAQARYMSWLLQVYHGDNTLALAAYNYGCGHINKLINKYDTHDYNKLKPYLPTETQNYVRNITVFLSEYSRQEKEQA